MSDQKRIARTVPCRDRKYMGLAWFYASYSKDPDTQVGAVIVGKNNKIVGIGYNGPPECINDDEVNWNRPEKGSKHLNKLDLMKHAESNAIRYSHADKIIGSTLYVTALPCPNCMLDIICSGIKKVVYFDFRGDVGSSLRDESFRSKTFEIAESGSVLISKFKGDIRWVKDWISKLEELDVI